MLDIKDLEKQVKQAKKDYTNARCTWIDAERSGEPYKIVNFYLKRDFWDKGDIYYQLKCQLNNALNNKRAV